MNPRRTTAFLAFVACLGHAGVALAQAPVIDARDLDERLKRLERLLASESLLKLFQEVESIKVEVRELRGDLEARSHTLDQIENRQRELYLDADQRLQRLESAPPIRTADAAVEPATQPPATQPTSPSPAPVTPPQGTTPDPSATAPSTAAETGSDAGIDPFAEQQAYQTAFDLLKSGRYEDAAGAFMQFIADFPAGSYADNARYWLGETYYITRRFEPALQEFERLVSMHPDSSKLTHALLKIGYAHDELGNEAEAERVLGDLIARYPQSAAAGLARKRLVSIRR